MNYKIIKNNIYFKNEKLSAKEIFQDYYTTQKEDLIKFINENNLILSKYPHELKFHIDINGNGKFFYEIYLSNINKKIEFNFHNDEAAIIDKNWYPIDQINLNDSRKTFSELNLSSHYLSLFQYLSLNLNEVIYVENHASNKLDKIKFIKPFDAKQIPNFKATLSKYQEIGVQWMHSMYQENVGLILADEMGLGKTVQYIALYCKVNNGGKKLGLVLTNSSNLENVKREFDKFTFGLKYMIYSGPDRNPLPRFFHQQNVIITSYDVLINDIAFLEQFSWEIIVSDEAQYIKNPLAKRAIAIKKLKSNFNLAISGTPYENNLDDLWSIFQFIMPVWLGNFEKFKRNYDNDQISAEKLNPIIKPLILQRKITEVEKELPKKIVIDQVIEMDENLKEQYENLRKSSEDSTNIINLRIFCNYPNMIEGFEDYNYYLYPKFQFLMEKLHELKKTKRKSLVFINYKKLIYFIEETIKKELGIYCNKIYGGTEISSRQNIIDEFSSIDGSAVLLLNPVAASVGLNITAANYVFLFSPEWKPSIEKQAIARAYRKGQEHTVFAYRLSYKNTIEEYVLKKSKFKEDINEIVLPGHMEDIGDIDVNAALSESPL